MVLWRCNYRITLFIPNLHAGGAQRVAIDLAKNLASRGANVTLLVGEGGPFEELVSENVKFEKLNRRSATKCLVPLVRHLRQAKPDIVVSFMRHSNIIAALAHKIAGGRSKLIVSERVSLLNAAETVGDRIVKFMIPFIYPLADIVATVSQDMAREFDRYRTISSSRVRTLYNPVIDDQFEKNAAIWSDEMHPWLAAGKTEPVLIALGRMDPQKGYDVLLDSFAIAKAHRPDLRLIILGDGKLRTALEGKISALDLTDQVSLPGFVTNPLPYLKRADLFVLSSYSEGLPGALIQAMGCGLPVVSTDCPTGPAEILENGVWGVLVPVGDSVAMAEAILESLDQKSHPNTRERAQRFSEDGVLEDYFQLFSELVEN